MQEFFPYRISHIRLNELNTLPKLETRKQGNYLVFWWEDIVLGDLYIEEGAGISPEVLQQKLIAAIEPTLRFYNEMTDATDLVSSLAKLDLSEWRSVIWPIIDQWDEVGVNERKPVSVVVCTRNRAAHLQNCLERLQKLSCLPSEIIVVDNAPDDDSTYQVVSNFPNVTYVKEPRGGLDIARNTGIKAAKYPIVAFVDDDVVVHPLWIYRVWQTFEDPAVAAMTGLVIAAELETEAQIIFEKFWSFNRGYTDKTYDSDFFNRTLGEGPPVWEIGAGANMAFRKSVFDQVGLFDELLDVAAAGCSGDSEMWYRILANGHSIHYNPRAVVFHEHRKDIAGLKKQIFFYMRGFTAAALVQQSSHSQAGYRHHLFRVLPKHYVKLMKRGFPFYRFQFRTLFVEIQGLFSGLVYYQRNLNRSSKFLRR